MDRRKLECRLHARPAFRGIGVALRAFSLVDVLVTIAVIAVLVGLMLPTIAGIRETTRKVVCASNARQLGLGIAMYADDHRGSMPPSQFAAKSENDPTARPSLMMLVRLQQTGYSWDGLGVLFDTNYINAPGVFYCPSHRGGHPYRHYAELWSGDAADISCNYHYRGSNPKGSSLLARFDADMAIISDGLQTRNDLNHIFGANVIAADLRVAWVDGENLGLEAVLASPTDNETQANARVADAWQFIDAKLKNSGR